MIPCQSLSRSGMQTAFLGFFTVSSNGILAFRVGSGVGREAGLV